MLWVEGFDVQLQSFSPNHIDTEITCGITNQKWRFIGVYDHPKEGNKYLMWELLGHLHRHSSLPWLCMEDVNEKMFDVEKKGGLLKAQSCMQSFCNTIDSCNLEDLGFDGYPFTWSKDKSGADNIQERIDRVFANESWLLLFPFYRILHVNRMSSDHCAIHVSFDVINLNLVEKKELYIQI